MYVEWQWPRHYNFTLWVKKDTTVAVSPCSIQRKHSIPHCSHLQRAISLVGEERKCHCVPSQVIIFSCSPQQRVLLHFTTHATGQEKL